MEREQGGTSGADNVEAAEVVSSNFPLECVGVSGLWPCGEGAGYAGGIVSAAVDGARSAAALLRALPPLPESSSRASSAASPSNRTPNGGLATDSNGPPGQKNPPSDRWNWAGSNTASKVLDSY